MGVCVWQGGLRVEVSATKGGGSVEVGDLDRALCLVSKGDGAGEKWCSSARIVVIYSDVRAYADDGG